MVRISAVVADFESTMTTKIIHSMSFMVVHFHSDGYTKRGILRTIFIQEALQDPLIAEDSAIQAKLGRTLLNGGSAKILPFRTAMLEFLYSVQIEGDGNWLAHSMDRELEIVQATDHRYRTGLFPMDLKGFPHACTVHEWSRTAKLCTQHILTMRCPKFFDDYTRWMTNNGWSCTKFSAKLEDFVRYVIQDKDYKQKHTSPQDVQDLVIVLERAHALDSIVLDGHSFLISPPVSSWARLSYEQSCTQPKTS